MIPIVSSVNIHYLYIYNDYVAHLKLIQYCSQLHLHKTGKNVLPHICHSSLLLTTHWPELVKHKENRRNNVTLFLQCGRTRNKSYMWKACGNRAFSGNYK